MESPGSDAATSDGTNARARRSRGLPPFELFNEAARLWGPNGPADFTAPRRKAVLIYVRLYSDPDITDLDEASNIMIYARIALWLKWLVDARVAAESSDPSAPARRRKETELYAPTSIEAVVDPGSLRLQQISSDLGRLASRETAARLSCGPLSARTLLASAIGRMRAVGGFSEALSNSGDLQPALVVRIRQPGHRARRPSASARANERRVPWDDLEDAVTLPWSRSHPAEARSLDLDIRDGEQGVRDSVPSEYSSDDQEVPALSSRSSDAGSYSRGR